MNSKELRMIRFKGISKRAIFKPAVAKVIGRIKHEFGITVWQQITETLEVAKANQDSALWYAAVDPLIEAVLLKEEAAEKKKVEKAQDAVEKLQKEKENKVKVKVNPTPNVVVRRANQRI